MQLGTPTLANLLGIASPLPLLAMEIVNLKGLSHQLEMG
jgi:hypothetical protein